MRVETFESRLVGGNCYLIVDEDKSIVIDPCVNYEIVYKNQGSKIQGVFITHGHFDHIHSLDSYLIQEDIKFYMHRKCLEKIEDPQKNYSTMAPKPIKYSIPKERIVFVDESSKINLLRNEIKILETPGHSDCSICIIIDKLLFSGDTLFKLSVGRTDLYSSNTVKLLSSLEKIKKLNVNYQVYPGHSESTFLDDERLSNPYLNRR